MKCKQCGAALNKKDKFCLSCGAKVKRGKKRFFQGLIIILALALISGAVCWKFELFRIGSQAADTIPFLALQKGFTETTITDENSAVAVAKEMGIALQYENALDEMSVSDVQGVSTDTYYRLQQNYSGIPVYGRAVVFCAAEDGSAVTMTGNPKDIDANISLTPEISQEDAENAATDYFYSKGGAAEDAEITFFEDVELQIYSLNGCEDTLVYVLDVWVSDDTVGDNYKMLVNSYNGEVILKTTTSCSIADKITVTSSDGQAYAQAIWDESASKYFLEDVDNSIAYANLNGINSQLIVGGETAGTKTLTNLEREFVKIFFGEDYISVRPYVISSETGTSFSDTDIYFAYNISSICNYFVNRFNDEGYPQTLACYNDFRDFGINASGGSWGDNGLIRIGQSYGVMDMDVMAHEYTHVITYSHNIMRDTFESQVIHEGIADIFGCLIEKEITRELDWNVESDFDLSVCNRNIENPDATNNPTILPTTLSKHDEHYYSTLVSHPAYLMWAGIDGVESSKISEDSLAELWYRSILLLPSDCTLEQLRTSVETAANQMNTANRLTDKQVECVYWAFDQVGIEGSPYVISYTVKPEFQLCIYDINFNLYDYYTVKITTPFADTGIPQELKKLLPATKTYSCISAEPLQIQLNEGVYLITLTDQSNAKNQYQFSVAVNAESATNSLELHTTFGQRAQNNFANSNSVVTLGDEFEYYQQALQTLEECGSFTTDMTTKSVTSVAQGSTTAKVTTNFNALCTIENYNTGDMKMTGSATLTGGGLDYAYDMSYRNGVAYYDFTKPSVQSVSYEMPFDLMQFEAIDESAVTYASGGTSLNGEIMLVFTVDGTAVTASSAQLLPQLLGEGYDVTYGDIEMTVIIDQDSGALKSITMVFDTSMTASGYEATASNESVYEFTILN